MNGNQKKQDFIDALDGLSSSIINITFDVEKPYLETLELSIKEYMDNYPSIEIIKDELNGIVEKNFNKKHYSLKKIIDTNIGDLKYKLEDNNVDENKIINDEINKYRTMFISVSAGTNISYLGLVDECTDSIMAMLIRKNTSISFARRTQEVRNDIYNYVNKCFLDMMVSLGDVVLEKWIDPLNDDFRFDDNGISKIKN